MLCLVFIFQDHLMHRLRRHAEVLLDLCFGRRLLISDSIWGDLHPRGDEEHPQRAQSPDA